MAFVSGFFSLNDFKVPLWSSINQYLVLFLWLKKILLSGGTTFYSFICWWIFQLLLHFLAIINDASMNIYAQFCVHMCAHVFCVLVYNARSRIVGSHGNTNFKNCHCFPKQMHHFTFLSIIYVVCNLSTPLPTFVVISILVKYYLN